MNESISLVLKLLADFGKSLPKRSSFFISYYLLPKLLEWNFQSWKEEMQLLGKEDKDLNLWSEYYQILHQTEVIFNDIEKRVLSENSLDIHAFFEALLKHVNKLKDEKVLVKEGDERYYIEDILSTFYTKFFELISEFPNRYHLWDTFPKEWKILTSTIKDSRAQQITLSRFFEWTQAKLSSSSFRDKKADTDHALNDIAINLFPEVEPAAWAAILTLVLSSYDPEARLKSVVEKPWIFGGYGRVHGYGGVYGENAEDAEKKLMAEVAETRSREETATIELILVLSNMVPAFYHTFKEEALQKLIQEASSLNYATDSAEYKKAKLLLDIFQRVLQSKKNNIKSR